MVCGCVCHSAVKAPSSLPPPGCPCLYIVNDIQRLISECNRTQRIMVWWCCRHYVSTLLFKATVPTLSSVELLNQQPVVETFVSSGVYETVCLPSKRPCIKSGEVHQQPLQDHSTPVNITNVTYSLPDLSKKKVWWSGDEGCRGLVLAVIHIFTAGTRPLYYSSHWSSKGWPLYCTRQEKGN